MGKRATGDSNVLKLDRILGLITGADISGTTADTVFALETIGINYLTAAYYMLPLATIVHNNHHALIEVALALSMNGVLDYHIGFYDTLLPKGTGVVPSELEGVEEILDDADRDYRNRYFVVYYDDRGNVAGCIVMSRSEAWDLRYKMCFQATRLLDKAPSLPLCPSRDTVLSLFDGNLKIN